MNEINLFFIDIRLIDKDLQRSDETSGATTYNNTSINFILQKENPVKTHILHIPFNIKLIVAVKHESDVYLDSMNTQDKKKVKSHICSHFVTWK